MNESKHRCVLTLRVSSKQQRDEGFSLPAQEAIGRSYAERNDLEITKVYSIAETASKPAKRKLFNEMMAYIEEHDVKVLIVEKVDRLVRSLQDTVRMNTWLDEDPERQIHSIKDSLVLHKHSR